jgi:hypothetical protein
VSGPPPSHDDVNLQANKLGGQLRVEFSLAMSVSVLDGDILTVDVAEVA